MSYETYKALLIIALLSSCSPAYAQTDIDAQADILEQQTEMRQMQDDMAQMKRDQEAAHVQLRNDEASDAQEAAIAAIHARGY